MKPYRAAICPFVSLESASTEAHRAAGGWLRPAVAALVVLMAMVPAFGQETRSSSEDARPGSIHGTITTKQDNAPAGLSGVTVRLTSERRDVDPLTVDTDDAGRYEFKSLKPGTYTISISQLGFKSWTKSISVNPGQTAVQDVSLELE